METRSSRAQSLRRNPAHNYSSVCMHEFVHACMYAGTRNSSPYFQCTCVRCMYVCTHARMYARMHAYMQHEGTCEKARRENHPHGARVINVRCNHLELLAHLRVHDCARVHVCFCAYAHSHPLSWLPAHAHPHKPLPEHLRPLRFLHSANTDRRTHGPTPFGRHSCRRAK